MTASYSLSRATSNSASNFTFSVTAGTRGLGSGPAQLKDNRAYATGNFAHLNADLSHIQMLPWDFQVAVRFYGASCRSALGPDRAVCGRWPDVRAGLSPIGSDRRRWRIGMDGVAQPNADRQLHSRLAIFRLRRIGNSVDPRSAGGPTGGISACQHRLRHALPNIRPPVRGMWTWRSRCWTDLRRRRSRQLPVSAQARTCENDYCSCPACDLVMRPSW